MPQTVIRSLGLFKQNKTKKYIIKIKTYFSWVWKGWILNIIISEFLKSVSWNHVHHFSPWRISLVADLLEVTKVGPPYFSWTFSTKMVICAILGSAIPIFGGWGWGMGTILDCDSVFETFVDPFLISIIYVEILPTSTTEIDIGLQWQLGLELFTRWNKIYWLENQ